MIYSANQDRNCKISACSQPPRAVALVMHGLNLKPSKMGAIAQLLSDAGHEVIRGSLSGHRGDPEEFKTVTREIWLTDMHRCYWEARRLADALQLPLHFVGFSLGAVLILDLMNSRPKERIRFDRMVLLAPALALHPSSSFLKFFRFLGRGFVVPSLAHPDYRANEAGTPIAAYEALFDSIAQVRQNGISQNIPTLIMMDRKDELVSLTGLKKLAQDQQLSNWNFSSFTSAKKGKGFRHLIVDESNLGDSRWDELKKAILDHIGR